MEFGWPNPVAARLETMTGFIVTALRRKVLIGWNEVHTAIRHWQVNSLADKVFAIVIFLVLFRVLVWILPGLERGKERETRHETARQRDDCSIFEARLIDGNHPLIGSNPVDITFALSAQDLTLLITGRDELSLPLTNVRALATSLYEIQGKTVATTLHRLVGTDKVVVLTINDSITGCDFTCVLKMAEDRAFVDAINRLRYTLFIDTVADISPATDAGKTVEGIGQRKEDDDLARPS